MDFKHVTDCFEGTIFADDYRTNLKAASERIAALESRVAANPNVYDRTGLLLAQVVYSYICGDFVSANSYLDQLYGISRSSNDSSLLSRCTAYDMYVQCTKNIPPVLRFRIDSDTGPAILRSIGISAFRARFLRQRIEGGTAELSSLEKFEANILRICTSFMNDLWLEAFPEHPRYFKNHPIVLFRGERNYWDNIRQSGDDTNFPAITSYLNRLTLQYRLAGGASNAQSSLLSMYEDVLERGELVAAAHFQLQLGDAILSPPFTSPFALNLVSVVREIGWTNDMWDKKQQEFPLTQDTEAMQCYHQAYFLFEAASSERGMAAVLLRFACLDLASAIMEPPRKDVKTEQNLIQSAYDHLTAAKELFTGDITNSLIVDGHLAICKIMREDLYAALKMCFNIGEVGRHTGNTCTCEFVGILYLRLARRLASDETRVHHAAVLCTCATVCFKALNNPYLELHAVAASAKLHQQRGDVPMARKHVQNGRTLLGSTITYFNDLEAQIESLRSSHEDQEQRWLDHDSEMLQSKHTGCVVDFDHLASSIGISQQSSQSRSSSSSNQVSPMVAMLQSIRISGMDSSFMAGFQSLIPGVQSKDILRQRYDDVIKSRRHELVNNADIDAAEKHLTYFLQELEQSPFFSEEVETMKTAICQYLGDYSRAKNTITRVLPTSFGGTRATLPVPSSAGEQIKDMMYKAECQKFDRAVSLCFAAKDWKRGMAGVQAMLQRDATYLDEMKSSEDPHIWYNMVWMASILEQNGHLERAFQLYLNAFHVVEAHRQQLADIKDRRDILATVSSGELYLGMARIAFHFSQSPDGPLGPSQHWQLMPNEWKDQTLRFLELGRSRTLLDLIIAQKLAPQDFRDWSEYSYELRCQEGSISAESTAETRSQSGAESELEDREIYLERMYQELVKELKSQSLSKLLPESATIRESNSKLYQSIPDTAIVLHISSGREGLMILCITSQGIVGIHTAKVTDLQLDRHIFRFAKLFREKELKRSDLPAVATCNQHLQAISDEIIEPVAQHIKAKEHVIFIPSPSLNKFPLCALFYNNEPLFLSKDVSQSPSLSVLQHLIDKKRQARRKVDIIYKNPDGPRQEALDFSTSSAIHIARSFRATLQAATPTLTQGDFIEMYEQSDVLLIATHGTASTKSAWESSILMHPPFQVRELVKLQSCASLVIFEACVSGRGEESIGNDLLGFSHAVLASGATAFLGGLWNLNDEASALLMLFLFEELKTDKGSKTLARCWRNAQKKLYELDAAGVVAIFEDMRKSCVKAYKTNLINRELAAQLRRTLEIAIKEILQSETNYRHPFYWAPFVLIGHAGLVLDFR